MNIIQKFKTRNRLSKLLIGGNIPKLQTTWLPLYTELQRAALEWGRLNAARTAEQVLTAVGKADERNSQRQKAHQRANRNTKAPFVNNTAKLQEALFKAGFFDEGTTFNKAVDGIRGKMTNRAVQRAKDAGYKVNIDAGTIIKTKNSENQSISQRNNSKNGLAQMYETTHAAQTGGMSRQNNPSFYKDSENTGLQAILDHKRNLNVKNNYAVIDKKNKTLNIYSGDLLLEKHPITLGKNIGDGMLDPSSKYYSETSGTTGAGVFIAHGFPTSPYNGEPIYQMLSDVKTSKYAQAIHAPAGRDRIDALRNPKRSKRVSFGCTSPDCGIVKHLYNDKILLTGDTIYVLPEVEGNEIIEKNGKLQMSWGNKNPKTYSKGRKHYTYNNLK